MRRFLLLCVVSLPRRPPPLQLLQPPRTSLVLSLRQWRLLTPESFTVAGQHRRRVNPSLSPVSSPSLFPFSPIGGSVQLARVFRLCAAQMQSCATVARLSQLAGGVGQAWGEAVAMHRLRGGYQRRLFCRSASCSAQVRRRAAHSASARCRKLPRARVIRACSSSKFSRASLLRYVPNSTRSERAGITRKQRKRTVDSPCPSPLPFVNSCVSLLPISHRSSPTWRDRGLRRFSLALPAHPPASAPDFARALLGLHARACSVSDCRRLALASASHCVLPSEDMAAAPAPAVAEPTAPAHSTACALRSHQSRVPPRAPPPD